MLNMQLNKHLKQVCTYLVARIKSFTIKRGNKQYETH